MALPRQRANCFDHRPYGRTKGGRAKEGGSGKTGKKNWTGGPLVNPKKNKSIN